MQEIESIINVKLLLGCIAALLGCNIGLIVYMAKKYINITEKDHEKLEKIDVSQIDEDHDLLMKMRSEHMIFHKTDTGMKF